MRWDIIIPVLVAIDLIVAVVVYFKIVARTSDMDVDLGFFGSLGLAFTCLLWPIDALIIQPYEKIKDLIEEKRGMPPSKVADIMAIAMTEDLYTSWQVGYKMYQTCAQCDLFVPGDFCEHYYMGNYEDYVEFCEMAGLKKRLSEGRLKVMWVGFRCVEGSKDRCQR